MNTIVNTEKLIGLFSELVSQDALSFNERQVADILKRELEHLGFQVTEDDAGTKFGSDTGNLYGMLKGTDPGKRPVLLSAHMDTVAPGIGKKACVDTEKGLITSDGNTVLGADDVAGIVEILEGIRLAAESPGGHGDIEVLFTIAEEVYGKGSQAFDYSRIKSDTAYIVDMSGPVGKAARAAPSIIYFDFEIIGKSAHAGFNPGGGINAIQIASEIISRTEQGLLGDGLTLNIGTISGGRTSNIISDSCRCTGEARGMDHSAACEAVKELSERIEEYCDRAGAKFDFNSEIMIRAYETPETDISCRNFVKACSSLGMDGTLVATRGGSDNNVFAQKGINGIVLSCGMNNTHSVTEYINISELEKGSRLIAEILKIS